MEDGSEERFVKGLWSVGRDGRGLGGFEDDVGVGGGVGGADEADGAGDAEFEGGVGFEGDLGEKGEAVLDDGGGVVGAELLGHEDGADGDGGEDGAEDVGDGGDVVGEGEVDGFDLGPEGEAAIRDDEGVGVAEAGEKGGELGVEDAGF